MPKFLCIGLSPSIQRTVSFDSVIKNSVNRSSEYRFDASGKAANSARVLNQLERNSARVVCPLGAENISFFKKLAERDGLAVNPVEIPGRTRECWTLLDASDGGTTELVAEEPLCSPDFYGADEPCFSSVFGEAEEKLFEIVRFEVKNADAVLVAGSSPASWKKETIPYIAKIVSQSKKVFLADYWGKTLLDTIEFCVPNIIKINEEEFLNTFGTKTSTSDGDFRHLVSDKSIELGCILVVTRGEKSTFAADKGNFVEFPVEKIKAVNTTASGDAFSAGFLYEYLKSKDFLKSLEKGTWCAARNAESKIPGSIL